VVSRCVLKIMCRSPFAGGLWFCCLVKSLNARNLGDTEEGGLINNPATLKKVKERYSDAKMVVPGHGRPGGIDLIDHTIRLCNNRK
jgi:metallo-beta-lactamase class B